MERKTHTLLEKFVRNSISSQEGKELKDSVAKMSDEELTQTLSDVWENYGTSVTVPDGVSHFMKKLSPAAHFIYFSQSCGGGYHTGFVRNSNIFLL